MALPTLPPLYDGTATGAISELNTGISQLNRILTLTYDPTYTEKDLAIFVFQNIWHANGIHNGVLYFGASYRYDAYIVNAGSKDMVCGVLTLKSYNIIDVYEMNLSIVSGKIYLDGAVISTICCLIAKVNSSAGVNSTTL